jgi:hypothetical protein
MAEGSTALASARMSTRAAPARFSTLAQASAVAPVVIKLCPINSHERLSFYSWDDTEFDAIEALMKRAEANEARFTF